MNKGYCKLGQVKGDFSGRERVNSSTQYTCVAQHVIKVWIGPGAGDLESTVAQEFVKHAFKVLLHHVVDGPLQAWLNTPRTLTPGITVYFGPKAVSEGATEVSSGLTNDP